MQVLAGDIGGTKTRLGLFDVEQGRPTPVVERTYRSASYPSVETVLEAFFADVGRPQPLPACFGVAGPVRGNLCRVTNLPWEIDMQTLARALGFTHASLLNDLEASAWGIQALTQDDFCTLSPGAPDALGNIAVIAAGTGLGEAGLFWDGQRHLPFASEGGHSDFSPSSDQEIALLRFLQGRFTHVSWERVLSGPGLSNIYSFLLGQRKGRTPPWLAREMETGEPAAAISRAGISGRDPLCGEALDLFVHLYGVEAGNQALKVMAKGGVYITGGIAPKILEKLKGPTFLKAFSRKGRMEPLLRDMPVRVVLNDRCGLLGPAIYAAGAAAAPGTAGCA